jgi:outer membrane protein assembly factor BamB
MKTVIGTVVGISLFGTTLWAQDPTRAHTRPLVPDSEELGRLNLQLSWRVYLPSDGLRDGIYSFQMTNEANPAAKQIFMQMRSGAIIALDATSGVTRWRARVGTPYAVSRPLGYNSSLVFVVQGVHLYALSRATGQIQWESSFQHAPTTEPIADDDRLYVTLTNGRLQAYDLPRAAPVSPAAPAIVPDKRSPPPEAPAPALVETARPMVRLSGAISIGNTGSRVGGTQGMASISAISSGGRSLSAIGATSSNGRTVSAIGAASSSGRTVHAIGSLTSAAQATATHTDTELPMAFEYPGDSRLESPILLANKFILLPGQDGTLITIYKIDGRYFYRIPLDSVLSSTPGQCREAAYFACEDANVHAVDIVTGRVLWRFLGNSPVQQKPAVNDEDVYLHPERSGLYRLDRASGQVLWRNPGAERFLAATKTLVYATDRAGRLLVLDRARGTQLGSSDGGRNFVFPIANEATDRLFLASHDGLLVCLHDRNSPTPVLMKTPEEPQPLEGQPAPKAVSADKPAAKPEKKKPAKDQPDEPPDK